MKRLYLLALLVPSLSYAQPTIEAKKEAADLQAQLAALQTRFDENEAQGATLVRRNEDLTWTAEQVEKQILDLEADSATLDARGAELHEIVVNHNSRCSGEYEDEAYVAQCNSNADAINGEIQKHGSDIDAWNARRDLINEAIQTQTEQENLVYAQYEQYLATRSEIIDAANRIQQRLAEIQPFIDSCEEAIRLYDESPSDARAEIMHAACGTLFDGN